MLLSTPHLMALLFNGPIILWPYYLMADYLWTLITQGEFIKFYSKFLFQM